MTGLELRHIRKTMRLTQFQLAAALSLSPTWIGQMEREDQPIARRTAWAVIYLSREPEEQAKWRS